MDNILTDLSTPALQRGIKENLFEFCRAAAQFPGGELQEDDSFSQWYSGVPHPWFNAVLARRPGNDRDVDRVKTAIEYFRSKQIGPFAWWLAPGIVHADWESILTPLGFGFSDDTPGMAVDLASLNEDITAPSDFRIEFVDNEDFLNTWVTVFIEGYGVPADFRESVYRLMLNFGFDRSSRNYLGLLNGKPVATSNVFLGAGVAGIQMVATLPEARGRGIGAAITLQPLLDARKLGFKHLCQMENFYLSP